MIAARTFFAFVIVNVPFLSSRTAYSASGIGNSTPMWHLSQRVLCKHVDTIPLYEIGCYRPGYREAVNKITRFSRPVALELPAVHVDVSTLEKCADPFPGAGVPGQNC